MSGSQHFYNPNFGNKQVMSLQNSANILDIDLLQNKADDCASATLSVLFP